MSARRTGTKVPQKDELDWQVRELGMYINSDDPLYQKKVQWFKNMWKKYKAGDFDPDKSKIGFSHLTNEAAQKYNNQDFGEEFKIGTFARQIVNGHLVAEFVSAARNKEYDFMR